MKNLRVAQIIETMEVGGAENLAVRLANYLASKGHDSSLIVLTKPGPLSSRVNSGVNVYYLSFVRSSVRNPFNFLMSVQYGYRKLASVIQENDIQVVQSHLPGSNFLGLLLEFGKVCPVLATIHNNEEFRYGEVDNEILVRARKFAYSQLLRRGHGIIAVSEDVRISFIRQIGCGGDLAQKITVVTNAVPLPEPMSLEEKMKLRDKLGIPVEVPFILAAGRLSEQKNYRDLISAASILHADGVKFQLIIGGEGELRETLQSQIVELKLEGYVQLPGLIGDLNQVMQSADVFVMSSLWEGLPLVLLEAMACGLPTVAFNIPGINEVIENQINGIKIPVNDIHAMVKEIRILLGDDRLKKQIGDAAARSIQKNYSFDRMMETLIDLYEQSVELEN